LFRRDTGGQAARERFSAVVTVLIVLAIWSALTYSGSVPRYFLSSPSNVAKAAVALTRDHSLAHDVAASILRITIGFLMSAMIALPVGMLMGRSRAVWVALMPSISFVRYLPVPALVPFCILWFGIGEFEKVVIVFIGVFFQLVIMVADIVQHVPGDLVEAGRSLGLRGGALVRRVINPYSVPEVVEALRVTLGWAWGWVILAEVVGASSGLGFMIIKSQRYLLNSHMVVGLLIVGAIGFITDYAIRYFEGRIFRWKMLGT